jgi:hypothetical protein
MVQFLAAFAAVIGVSQASIAVRFAHPALLLFFSEIVNDFRCFHGIISARPVMV